MVMRPLLGPADPETLGLIFFVSGTFAVLTFQLYQSAPILGEQLPTPAPLEALRKIAVRVLAPFDLREAA